MFLLQLQMLHTLEDIAPAGLQSPQQDAVEN